MALLYVDGFDDYTSNANAQLWWGLTSASINSFSQSSLNGVNGSSVIVNQAPSAIRSLGSNLTTLIVGFRMKLTTSNLGTAFGAFFYDGTANGPQLGLGVDNTGAVHVYRGGWNKNADLGTISGFTFTIGVSYYFEIKCTFATGATGSVTVQINGGSGAGGWTQTFSSVQTAQTANAYANAIAIGSTGGTWFIDDLYVASTSGGNVTNFLGDVRVEDRYPAGAGRLSQWATQVGGTGGSPYTAVNETNPDGDTSYIADNTAGDEECFTLTTGSGTPSSLYGVQIDSVMRKDDTAAHVLASGVGNGTSESYDAGTSCSTTYAVDTDCMDTNPLTSAAWAPADLSTLQACVKVIS